MSGEVEEEDELRMVWVSGLVGDGGLYRAVVDGLGVLNGGRQTETFEWVLSVIDCRCCMLTSLSV